MSDPRVYFAAERTLLAWIRTGLTIMALWLCRRALRLVSQSPCGAAWLAHFCRGRHSPSVGGRGHCSCRARRRDHSLRRLSTSEFCLVATGFRSSRVYQPFVSPCCGGRPGCTRSSPCALSFRVAMLSHASAAMDRERKRPRSGAVILWFGGGGENRTRVRKRSTVRTTCLVASLCSHPRTVDGQTARGPVTLI